MFQKVLQHGRKYPQNSNKCFLSTFNKLLTKILTFYFIIFKEKLCSYILDESLRLGLVECGVQAIMNIVSISRNALGYLLLFCFSRLPKQIFFNVVFQFFQFFNDSIFFNPESINPLDSILMILSGFYQFYLPKFNLLPRWSKTGNLKICIKYWIPGELNSSDLNS